jgi:hypothetical protein
MGFVKESFVPETMSYDFEIRDNEKINTPFIREKFWPKIS